MPEPELQRIRVYCEGADDRAVLTALQRASMLPAGIELANPSIGKDRLASDVATLLRATGTGRAIALRDHDDLDAAAIGAWFERQMDALRGRGGGASAAAR